MDISEAKKTRDLNKVKYDRAMAKLKKMIEKRQISTISKAIKQVERTWQELEDAQDLFLVEMENSGNYKEGESNREKFADLECDMEQTINDAEIMIATENGEADKAKENPKGVLSQVKSSFVSAGEKVISTVENGYKTVRDTLASIKVSKKQYKEFEIALQDQLVSKWDEQSEAKFFQGVEISKYTKFLDNFQRSTEIDDKVRIDLENMDFTDRVDGKVKTFRCEGTNTSGKYGMYMAVKRPQEEKIDVAYAMYTFTATFVNKSSPGITYQAKPASKGPLGELLYRLTVPGVTDVLTGKRLTPQMYFKKGDMDALAENFIVTKALTAFAHNGIIPKVAYIEDQEEKPKIEDITDES